MNPKRNASAKAAGKNTKNRRVLEIHDLPAKKTVRGGTIAEVGGISLKGALGYGGSALGYGGSALGYGGVQKPGYGL